MTEPLFGNDFKRRRIDSKPFDSIPTELLLYHIFPNIIDAPTLSNISKVCRTWKSVIDEHIVWNLFKETKDPYTPPWVLFSICIREGNLNHIKKFYSLFSFTYKQKKRVFYDACREGNIEIIEWLLYEASINLADVYGKAVTLACENDYPLLLEYLMKKWHPPMPNFSQKSMIETCFDFFNTQKANIILKQLSYGEIILHQDSENFNMYEHNSEEYFDSAYIQTFSEEYFDSACQMKDIEWAKWIIKNVNNASQYMEILSVGCYYNWLEIIEWLYESYKDYLNLDFATSHWWRYSLTPLTHKGEWEAAEWLFSKDDLFIQPFEIPWRSVLVIEACRYGQLHAALFLSDYPTPLPLNTYHFPIPSHGSYRRNYELEQFGRMCEEGHLSTIIWFVEHFQVTSRKISSRKNIGLIFFFLDKCCGGNHTEVVQWIWDKWRISDIVENAIQQETRLSRNRCQSLYLEKLVNIFSRVCEKGHLEVATWFFSVIPLDILKRSKDSLSKATIEGHFSVVRLLVSKFGKKMARSFRNSDSLLWLSCMKGHYEMTVWLHEYVGLCFREDVLATCFSMDCAVPFGCHYRMMMVGEFRLACARGYFKCIEWWAHHYGLSRFLSLESAAILAEKNFHFKLGHWLRKRIEDSEIAE